MHMLNNKIESNDLKEYTGRDGTLTLEEVWKEKKQPSERKNTKTSKYFGSAEAGETTIKVHIIALNY